MTDKQKNNDYIFEVLMLTLLRLERKYSWNREESLFFKKLIKEQIKILKEMKGKNKK